MSALPQSAFEIARRIEIRAVAGGHVWLAVLRVAGKDEEAEDFDEELELALGARPARRHVNIAKWGELLSELRGAPSSTVVLEGFEEWDAVAWSYLDRDRDALLRTGGIILWLSAAAFASLAEHAESDRR